jgi:ABC-type oligopeptide transport system ATPase subunit
MVGDLVIETKALRKIFISKTKAGKKEVEAVKGIDLTIRKGEIFGFLGPIGAGNPPLKKCFQHYCILQMEKPKFLDMT